MIWDCPTWRFNQRKNILTNTNWDLTYNKKTSSTSQHADLNVAQVGVQPTNSMIYSETAGLTNIHRWGYAADNRPQNFIIQIIGLEEENCEWLGVPPFWETPHVPAMELWRVSQHFKHPNVNTKYIKNLGFLDVHPFNITYCIRLEPRIMSLPTNIVIFHVELLNYQRIP